MTKAEKLYEQQSSFLRRYNFSGMIFDYIRIWF